MTGITIALYCLLAPPADLLAASTMNWAARGPQGYLRWFSAGQAQVQHDGSLLARLPAPLRILADYQDPPFLRLTVEPNRIDNALLHGPQVEQIFVNGRKLSCRQEGPLRRVFYPILNNREPCER